MYISHEGNNYQYVNEHTIVSKIGIAVFAIAMIVVIYDLVKDLIRSVSVYGDIFKGKHVDVAKTFGLTGGNITRNVVKYSLLTISILMMSVTKNTEEIKNLLAARST
jgi:hypothetical protein